MAGLAVMLLTLVLTGLVGKDVKPAQAKMLEASEGTAAVTREIVESAKLIKMMLWEELYLEHVCAKRAVELRHIRRYRLLINGVVMIGRGSPIIATAVTLVVYSASGTLRADVAFPIIAIFQALRAPFIMLPLMVTLVTMIKVAAKRSSR